MTKKSKQDQDAQGQGKDDADAIKRHPTNQGGHEHIGGGHGGQQSGGMGGKQSGSRQGSDAGQPGDEQRAEAGGHESAEIQQSAQREGMGQRRHRNHGNQDLDASDADDVGSRAGAVADDDASNSQGKS